MKSEDYDTTESEPSHPAEREEYGGANVKMPGEYIHGGESEIGGYEPDQLAYLGHFANPEVLNCGHNTGAHPGFKAVQGKIEGEGYSKEAAGAILANATRHASAGAKKSNPHLKRVKG